MFLLGICHKHLTREPAWPSSQVQNNSWPTKTKTFPGANQTTFSQKEADGPFVAKSKATNGRRFFLSYLFIFIYIYIISLSFTLQSWKSHTHDRRKFRSQTSDSLDRWKSKGGKSQRREEKKKEDQTRERVRRNKIKVREKVEKSRKTVFFQSFVASEGRKVGLLKRRVRSHLVSWETKNWTPLWREADLEVKMLKTPQCRSTCRTWDVQKVPAVVARSTFRSKHVENASAWSTFGSWYVQKVHAIVVSKSICQTTFSFHFWRLRCGKVHAVVARSTFRSQNGKNTICLNHFWTVTTRQHLQLQLHYNYNYNYHYTTPTTTTTHATKITTATTTTLHYTTVR